MIELTPIIPRRTFDSEGYIKFLEELLHRSALKLYDALRKYPPNKDVPWSAIGGFKSNKQRNFVMSGIRRGVIQTPYNRTDGLGESWKVTSAHTTNELVYIVGTDFPTAKFVQDRDTQDKRMKVIGWPTTQDVAEKVWPKEVNKIQQKAAQYKPK